KGAAKSAASKAAAQPSADDQIAQVDRNAESVSLPPLGPANDPETTSASRLSPAKTKSARKTKSAHDQAAEMGPPSLPEPPRDGQQSLSRALGLKIGRIVIDAGHGGHDTGTIGPTGLMEKDL